MATRGQLAACCQPLMLFAAAAKKNVGTGGVSFFRFRFQITGCTGASYAVFRVGPAGEICFWFSMRLAGSSVGGEFSSRPLPDIVARGKGLW
jgi:hypothetical protein